MFNGSKFNSIAIIGSSGSIGHALVQQAASFYPEATITAFSRSESVDLPAQVQAFHIDDEESSIAEAVSKIQEPLDLVIVATGLLHNKQVQPEKSMRHLSSEQFHQVFHANTFFPALVAKHFIPKLARGSESGSNRSVFAALSARVGSITDNHLGGWYAYRSSKSALNMILKTLSIETARKNKQSIIVGLHPGTVESHLSAPFQSHVPSEKLFTPVFAAEKLMEVIAQLTPDQTGKCFAWDGQEIEP